MTDRTAQDMEAEAAPGQTLVSDTIGVITRHIRAHELGPGDRLPSESSLARELKVSRSVVREAFRSLAAMRLITLSAGRRATVAQLDHGAMSLVIEHGVLTEQISVQQIYDVRKTIEARTATLASLRRTDEEAEAIRFHALQMQAHVDDAQSVMEHDLAIHLRIAQASRNPVFAMILGAFQGVTRQTWPIGWRSRVQAAQRDRIVRIHIGIADAIARGDPQAAVACMNDHFDDSTRVLLDAGLM